MRITHIYCDGCGCEIKGRAFILFVSVDSSAFKDSDIVQDFDLCEHCHDTLGVFKDISLSKGEDKRLTLSIVGRSPI